jgi:putative methyltransferase (TIGR04325 family)
MIKKIKNYFKKKKYDYTKKFTTYNSAQNYLTKNNIYFDTRHLRKFDSPSDVEAIERFYAPALIAALSINNKINILDIGGGNNPIFSHIKKSTNISTYCTVLETKKFSDLINKKVPAHFKKYIKYISSLDQIKKKINIICFMSSIQYIKNYKEIILHVKKFNPKYFIISRTFFHRYKENFYSIEHTVPGSIHPYIFFSFEKLVIFFKKAGYELIFHNKYNLNIFSHDTVNENSFCHRDLVFKRL